IPDETALKILTQNAAMQKDPELLRALYTAIGRWGSEATFPILYRGLNEKNDRHVWQGACEGIGLLWTSASDRPDVSQTQLLRIAKLLVASEETGLACGFALSRYKGDPANLPLHELIEGALKSPSRPGRTLILKAIARVRSPQAATFLTTQLYS